MAIKEFKFGQSCLIMQYFIFYTTLSFVIVYLERITQLSLKLNQTLNLPNIQITMINPNRINLPYQPQQKTYMQASQKRNQSSFVGHHKENILSINPTFNQNSSRPLISPKKQQNQPFTERLTPKNAMYRQSQVLRPQQKNAQVYLKEKQRLNCLNHPNKLAEFKVDTEEGLDYFCGRCAAQLATQGCEVQRMVNSGASMKASKRKQLPSLPQYQGEPMYEQIVSLLKDCNAVIQQHNSTIQKFSNLEEGYNQQIDLTTAFYDRLIEIIEEMKQDHLNDLIEERNKYTQIADIQNDNLRESIIEINVIKNDVEDHIEEVLEGIIQSGNTEECRESLDHYRQKLAFFRHRTQEQLEQLSQVTRYSQNKIDKMLEEFENFLKTMWDEQVEQQREQRQDKQIKQMNSTMTVKNIHQILPRGVSYEGQGEKRAFRNLEAEEQDIEVPKMQERKSPNFKKI